MHTHRSNRRTTTRLALLAALSGSLALSWPALARPMTLLDVARVRQVTAISLSPDGQQIAYTLAVPRRPLVEDDGSAWQELHVIGPSHESRPFVTGQVRVSNIQWRPNAREISFLQKRSGDKETSLCVIAVDGGEARLVLEHPTGVGAYTWSPDGHSIAFLAREKAPKQQSEDRDNGFAAEVFEEDWQSTKVWIASPRTKPTPWEETTPTQAEALHLPGSAHALEWSPDGQWLAVALAPTPGVDDELMRKKLHIVDVAKRSISGVVETPGKLGAFRWSPDSQSLALIATTDVHDPQQGRLLLARRDGGTTRELMPEYMGHFTQVEWLRNDALLALGDVGVWTELLEVKVAGGSDAVISAGRYVINQFDRRSSSSGIALLVESPAHPAEVFALKGGASEPTRLTDNNPWLADVQLAPQETVRHAARDGLELEGILVRPLNEEPGRRYPLILAVHGGPESHQANGWVTTYSRLGQAAAAQGFAVFYPNYRGSTGRGVEFSQLGQGDYAGGEFNDLVDAVGHLVTTGLVDDGTPGARPPRGPLPG